MPTHYLHPRQRAPVTAVNDARELLEGCEALIDARKFEQALSLCYQALAMEPATPRVMQRS